MQKQLQAIDAKANEIADKLRVMGISVKYDNADNKRPGFKFADYELKGVPVRLVMGGRNLENGTAQGDAQQYVGEGDHVCREYRAGGKNIARRDTS